MPQIEIRNITVAFLVLKRINFKSLKVDIENNHYPRQIIPSRLEVYKRKKSSAKVRRDIMHDIKTELKKDEEDKKENKD